MPSKENQKIKKKVVKTAGDFIDLSDKHAHTYGGEIVATKIMFDKDQGTAFIKRTGYIKPGEMLEGFKKLESSPFFGD